MPEKFNNFQSTFSALEPASPTIRALWLLSNSSAFFDPPQCEDGDSINSPYTIPQTPIIQVGSVKWHSTVAKNSGAFSVYYHQKFKSSPLVFITIQAHTGLPDPVNPKFFILESDNSFFHVIFTTDNNNNYLLFNFFSIGLPPA